MSGSPPTNQAEDDEGGGHADADEAEEEVARQVEEEQVIIGRLSLPSGDVMVSTLEQGEESKPHEEDTGPVDLESNPTERDGEEGNCTPNLHPV